MTLLHNLYHKSTSFGLALFLDVQFGRSVIRARQQQNKSETFVRISLTLLGIDKKRHCDPKLGSEEACGVRRSLDDGLGSF